MCLNFLLLFNLVLKSYPGDIIWTKVYGGPSYDVANDVIVDVEGNYVHLGYTWSYGAGTTDFWLVKTDTAGDTILTRTYGGADDDRGNAIVCIEGETGFSYVVVGYTMSYGNGLEDLWIIRTDSTGDTIWTRTIGGDSSDIAYDVAADGDSVVIVVGGTKSYGNGGWDFYVVKLNTEGDTIWTRTYGGIYDEVAYGVDVDPEGNYIIAGYTTSYGVGGDVWIVKLNRYGDTLWTKYIGGDGYDQGFDVCAYGNAYVIAGRTRSFKGSYNAYIIKLSSLGDSIWARTYGGAYVDEARKIIYTGDSAYVFVGYTNSFGNGGYDAWVVKIWAYDGDTFWTGIYGDTLDERGYSIAIAPGGYFIVSGYTDSYSNGISDFYAIKIYGNSALNVERRPEGVPIFITTENNGVVKFTNTFNQPLNVSVFNLAGRKIAEFYLKNTREIKIRTAGIYLVRVAQGERIKFYKLVVIK